MIVAMRRILVVAGVLFLTQGSYAQVARVTAAQRSTELKKGDADWSSAGVGANLGTSDKFRTGKRSKADLKFRDGSLVRLGQLSYLEMRGAKEVNLVRGQLLFVALRPGRVLAGAAAAAIKGSVALIQYQNYKNGNGKDEKVAQFCLYSGLMDVISALNTISLKPGQMATVLPDGTIKLGPAPPLRYFGGEKHPDILDKPKNNPFAGSKEQEDWRDDPERIERDQEFTEFFAPGGVDGSQNDTFPEEPKPDLSDFRAQSQLFSASSLGGPSSGGFATGGSGLSGSSMQGSGRIALQWPTRFTAVPEETKTLPQAAEDATGANAEGEFDLDASAAYKHLSESNFDLGDQYGGDIALVGAGASRGAYAYGARFRGFYAHDKWFADAAYFPLRVRARFEGDKHDKETRDFSAVSDLSLTYTDSWGEAQVGRQRFLSGPMQAALYGSLIRAGGREVMDAVRFAPNIGDDMSLEVAYLADAFPHNLPYRISGRQEGFYGRYALYKSFGNFGLNVLKYNDSEIDDTTGATIDFSLPIVRNVLEFYGELGRDPYRRHIRSYGITIPWLAEKTGWDVFFETAHLSDTRKLNGPPREYTVRAYKSLSQNINLVAAASKFSHNDTRFTVAVSIGARTSR